MKRRYLTFLSITLVWLFWVSIALTLKAQKIDKSEISIKEGVAIAAHCVKSRSVTGVKFKALYAGAEAADDYVSLPFGFTCDQSFIDKFKSKPIKISFYENHNLGFEIDGLTVFEVDKSIDKTNDKGAVLNFTFFMALVISLALFMYSRNRD